MGLRACAAPLPRALRGVDLTVISDSYFIFPLERFNKLLEAQLGEHMNRSSEQNQTRIPSTHPNLCLPALFPYLIVAQHT